MKRLVREDKLLDPDWQEHFGTLWAEEIAAESASARADGDPTAGPPEKWADYELKRQRAGRLAGQVRDLLLKAGPGDILPEQTLIAHSGRLKGKVDLIVRTPAVHVVIDYKTGAISGDDGEPVKAQYERQLGVYAALEHEAATAWPARVAIFPLKGPPVWIDVVPDECDRLALDAIAHLELYNAEAPGPQQANPDPEHCHLCDYSVLCGPFWATQPMPSLLALDGEVTDVFMAEQGSVTIRLAWGGEEIEIHGINPSYHPAALRVDRGDWARAVGAQLMQDDRRYRLPASARFRAT